MDSKYYVSYGDEVGYIQIDEFTFNDVVLPLTCSLNTISSHNLTSVLCIDATGDIIGKITVINEL